MRKSKLIIFLMISMVLLGGAPLAIYAAGTSVSGNITSSTWNEQDSPYVVDGTMEVSAGAKLIIQPGAVIKFNKGAKILVKGTLEAIGTVDKPIILTSNQTSPKRGDWTGIEFTDQSIDATVSNGEYIGGSIIKYAIIKYAQEVLCNDASPYFTNDVFLNNEIAIDMTGKTASEGQEVLDATQSASNHAGLVMMNIVNNEFSDNNIGIKVNRNNGRDYVISPSGKTYIGDKYVTANIKNNTVINNNQGVVILKGDNNILANNKIKFNSIEGVRLESGTGHSLQGNIINNNEVGLTLGSKEVVLLQNDIRHNFTKGIDMNTVPRAIKYNNIVDNKKTSLNNNAGNVDVSGNYWGAGSDPSINLIVNASGVVVFDPALTSAVNLQELIKPIIDSYITPTNASKAVITGIKPSGVKIYAGDSEIIGYTDKTEWQYEMSLEIGDNQKAFYFIDTNGTKGPEESVTIKRDKIIVVEVPTVTYEAKTTKGSVTLNGTKQGGVGIWINNGEAVAPDNSTTWTYNLALAKGENNISLFAKDSEGRVSQTVSIVITRTEIDVASVIKEEKSLTKKIDKALSKKMAGKLLLQVEKSGNIWYVNPKNLKRYYVTYDGALALFKALSVGITEKDLKLVPYKNGKITNKKLVDSLKGKFLLRVEAGGKIAYVDINGYRYDITLDNLMETFRSLSFGISNTDIRKIEVGSL